MKIFKKLIFTFIFFILFINVVNAKSEATITVPLWNEGNSQINLLKDTMLVNLKCTAQGDNPVYKEIDEKGIEYKTPAGNLTLAKKSGTYYIRAATNFKSNGDTITLPYCKYSEIANYNDHYVILDFDEKDRYDGDLTIVVEPMGVENDVTELVVQLYPLLGDTKQTIIGDGGFINEEAMAEYKNFTLADNSKGKLNISKSKKKFVVSTTEEAKKLTKDETYEVTINMESEEKKKYEIKVKVNVHAVVPIYALSAPVCNYDSNWQGVENNVASDSTSDFFSKYKTYYTAEYHTVTLPVCNNTGDPRYVFTGWKYESAFDGKGATSSSSNCTPTYSGGETVDVIKARGESSPKTKGSFIACYSIKPQITLSVTRGKIENDGSWEVSEETTQYSEYYYLLNPGEQKTFPVIKRTFDIDGVESTPSGWAAEIKNGDCYGTKFAPGSIIPHEGEYYACYNQSESIKNGEVITDGKRDVLEIIVGTELDFESEFIPNGEVNYVDKANDHIEIIKRDGKTFIKGIKKTEKKIRISVTGNYGDKGVYTIYYDLKVVPSEFEVVDIAYDGEGNIISTTGETYDVFGYIDTAEEYDPSCSKFKVELIDGTELNKGPKIAKGTKKDIILRAHLFDVKVDCEGKSRKYKGVCLDPGRDEPSSHNYYKDPSNDPSTSAVDRVAAYIKSKNKGDLSNNTLAASTFALRIIAILIGDDMNNKSSGINEYYNAYVDIANNIRALAGVEENKVVPLKDLEKWKTKTALKNATLDKFFCSAKGRVCSELNTDIAEKAKKYILEGLAYQISTGMTPKVGITKTETVWEDGNKKYIKYVDGVISGVQKTDDSMFNIDGACPTCEKAGVILGLYLGRDPNHLVKFHRNVDYYIATYGDYAESDWYPGQYTTEYASKSILNEETDEIYFRYVIPVSVDKIQSIAGGAHSSYNSSSAKSNDYNVYLSFGDDKQSYKMDVGVALPASSVNLQRIVMLAEGSSGSGTTISTSGLPGTGGSTSSTSIPATPPTEYTFTFTPGGKPGTFHVVYSTVSTSTILPTCDLKKPIFDYSDKANFNANLFRGAGCCAYVLNENSGLYKDVCKVTCMYQTLTPVCKVNKSGGSETGVEKMVIHEGKQMGEDGKEVGNMTCVYDHRNKAATTLSEKKDVAGNTYQISAYNKNSLCNVYCKEDWNFNLPDLHSHTGKNYVIAGQFFEINYKEISLSGKRTCVTSLLDLKRWKSKLCSLSSKMVAAFNRSQFSAGGTDLLGQFNQGLGMPGVTYEPATVSAMEAVECPKKSVNDKKESKKGTKIELEGDHCKLTYKPWDDDKNCGYTDTCDNPPAGHDKCYECKGDWSSSTKTESVDATKCKYTFAQSVQFTVAQMKFTCGGGIGATTKTQTGEAEYASPETYPGKCSEDTKPYMGEDAEQMRIAVAKDAATKGSKGGTGNWQGYKSRIKKLIEEMNQCQRFELTVEGKQGTRSETGSVIVDPEISTTVQEIKTIFDPKISFSYDEPEYMAKIGTNNQLKMVQGSDKYNESYTFYKKDGFNIRNYTGTEKVHGEGNQMIDLDAAQSAQAAYCTSGGSGTGHTGGTKETPGHTYHWSSEPDCYEISPKYYEYGWYIKRVLTFDAQFEKTHNWFTDSKSEFKEYAQTKEEAVQRSKSQNKDLESWSYYGSSDSRNLVFPVSERTPRNIYKYTFTYSNIGMYNNTVETGRIMGTTRSVIPNNKRVCFYEVIESICYCCGDITTYSVTAKNTGDMIKSLQDTDTSNPAYSYYDKATGLGGKYGLNFNQINVCKDGSEECAADSSNGAVSNIIVSNISLGSAKDNLGRTPGVNWQTRTQYNVEGDYYVTDKGAKLFSHIDDYGETIYDKMPEYSYTVSPAALSEIRKRANLEGYQPRTDTLQVLGKIKITNNGTNWNDKDGEEVGYFHFTSKFLREFMSHFITDGVNPITESEDICYVKEDEYDPANDKNRDLDKVYGPNNKIRKFFDGSRYHCRFIDYVGTVVPYDKDKGIKDGVGKYYRLSFK